MHTPHAQASGSAANDNSIPAEILAEAEERVSRLIVTWTCIPVSLWPREAFEWFQVTLDLHKGRPMSDWPTWLVVAAENIFTSPLPPV